MASLDLPRRMKESAVRGIMKEAAQQMGLDYTETYVDRNDHGQPIVEYKIGIGPQLAASVPTNPEGSSLPEPELDGLQVYGNTTDADRFVGFLRRILPVYMGVRIP